MSQRGFTMVELVVLIVVIGILSTVASSKLIGRGNVDAHVFAEQMRSMMRYAQKLAVAQNRPVFVSVSANRIALCFDAACADTVAAPGGGNTGTDATLVACGNAAWYCEGAPDDVALASPAALMFFDEQGRPFAGTDTPGTDNSTFSTLAIAVNGSAASGDVIVEQETGYVH